MTAMRSAFRSISRRAFRTLLISLVLAFCVAVLISTMAGVTASEKNTRDMVVEVEASTAEMIGKTELRTAEMVGQIEATTAAMVAGVVEGAEETTDLTDKMSRMILVIRGLGPNGKVTEDAVGDIHSIEGVVAVVPWLVDTVGGSGNPRKRDYDYAVNGVKLDSSLVEEYPVLPENVIAGRQIEEGDSGVVMLNSDLTVYFSAGVGDSITLEGRVFEVVGVFFSTGSFFQRTIYMSLEDAQGIFDKEDQVSLLQVFAGTQSEVDSVAGEIEAMSTVWTVRTMENMASGFGESIALTQEEQVARIRAQASLQIAAIQEDAGAQMEAMQEDADLQVEALQDDLGDIESLGVQISSVAGFAGVLIIFGMMFYSVRERTREIGVLKALGFSNSYIMSRFMLEGSCIGFLSGLIGVALGAAACSLLGPWLLQLSETPTTINPYHLLIGLGAAVVFGALGSLYPAWQASRVSPMVALRH